MRIIQNYEVATEQEIIEFISSSNPIENADFKLEKGVENAGWVNWYFKYNKKNFKVTLSLALDDLTKIVEFFENMMHLKEEKIIFLEDECISEPLLYVSHVDSERIRFLIADGREIYKKWNNSLPDSDTEPQLSDYEIRCNVIINEKELLKDFAESIKNIIKMNDVSDSKFLYDIGYDNWAKKFERILKFVNRI